MDKEVVKETIAKALIWAFEHLSFDPNEIYKKAQNHTLSEWRHKQEGLTGVAGAGAAIIPGLHIPALGADIIYLINRMDECCYGIGAIMGAKNGKGNILEKEDLALILALWSGAITVDQLDRELNKSRAANFGKELVAPVVGPAMSLGVLGGTTGSLTPMVASKIAAKLGAKIAAKTVAGWIPFAGAVVSGGINVWLVSSVSDAAEKYYIWRTNRVR